MNTYGHAFAIAYNLIWENRFALPISNYFPKICEHFGIHGKSFADIACGTGRFAYELAKRGYKGIGIDLSPDMIEIARKNTENENLELTFDVQDIRNFKLEYPIDFITCWFDSVNYLSSLEEAKKMMECCYLSLREGGAFLFDIETRAAFQNLWQRHRSSLAYLREFLGLSRRGHFYRAFYLLLDKWLSNSGQSVRTFIAKGIRIQLKSRFNQKSDILITDITGKVCINGKNLSISEQHTQKAFGIEDIKSCLYDVGFNLVHVFRHDFTSHKEDERRVYYCAFKNN